MFDGKKIVMVTPERLGDTLMCTPAIHYIKHYNQTSEIDIIALSQLSADVLNNNPDIHRVLVLPALKSLTPNPYDIAINIHDGEHARTYFEALNIPTKHIPPINPQLHQAEQALQFVQSLIPEHPDILERGYRLFPSKEDKNIIENLLKSHHVDMNKDILIGLQPGCHSLAKKRFAFLKKMKHPKIWPFESIVELAKKLYAQNPRIKIVITGSKSEAMLGEKLSKQCHNIVDLIDQTTVAQLHVLMENLRLFITPDTGLLHVACSTKVPIIALFGPTQLTRTGPYPVSTTLTLLQAPTMNEISPDTVLQTIMQKITSTN